MGGVEVATFVAAYGAVAFGSWRASSWAGVAGAVRILAAVTVGASFIVAQSLAAGLVGLGTTPLVLVSSAVACALAAHIVSPTPDRSAGDEFAAWVRGPRGPVVAAAAATGAGVGALAWVWWRPFVGYDGMLQNLVQINGWIHSGRPGAQRRVLTLAPVEAFPMTNDVVLGWHAALARSFAATSIWAVGAALVFALATSTLLRGWGVGAVTRWMATASVVSVPHFVGQLNSPKSDVAALAWLCVCAVLARDAARDPRLVVLAGLAGGLSIGSKTTTLPVVALILLVVVWKLRPPAGLVATGVIGGGLVGGVWYVRNLIEHGSPLWPFTSTPWGDPVAPVFDVESSRFVADPIETLQTQLGQWATVAAGGLALASFGLVVAAIFGSGRTRALVGVGVASLAIWTISPVTGLDNEPLADDVLTSTTRYLLPTMLLGALALATTAQERPRVRRACQAVFASVTVANLVAVVSLDGDVAPSVALVASAALVGGLVAAAVSESMAGSPSVSRRSSSPVLAGGLVAVVVVLGIGVAVASDGWTARHRRSLDLGGAPITQMLESPRFRSGSDPVAATNVIWSDLAGDELRHDVVLLESEQECGRYARLAREGWLVLGTGSFVGSPDLPLERGCLGDVEPFAADEDFVVISPQDR